MLRDRKINRDVRTRYARGPNRTSDHEQQDLSIAGARAHFRDNFAQLVRAHGYDHNWVLDHGGGETPGFAARAYDPDSGRTFDLYTTQPGLQFYTANGLNGSVVGRSGVAYRQTDAFALEAEHFPDSPNHPAFPTTELKPGETFHQVTVWRLGVR